MMHRCLLLLLLLMATVGDLLFAGQQTLTPIYERPVAPPLFLPDLDGKTISLTDYQGEVMVVNFWTSWCPACVQEMVSMQRETEWLARFKGRFIAVNMGEAPEDVAQFLA